MARLLARPRRSPGPSRSRRGSLAADNDAGFDKDDPDLATLADRYLEWLAQYHSGAITGKLSSVNDGNHDYNGQGDAFPDYADGFDYFAGDPRDDAVGGAGGLATKFIPIKVTLPASHGSTYPKFWFEYDAADPQYLLNYDPETPLSAGDDPRDLRHWYDAATEQHHYVLGEGTTRLWMAPADVTRKWWGVNELEGGVRGQYVDSTEWDAAAQEQKKVYYTYADFGINPATGGTVTLYLESVRASASLGAGGFTLHADLIYQTGQAGVEWPEHEFKAVHEVPVTAVNLGLAVDANRDGRIHVDGRDSTRGGKPFRFWVNDDAEAYDFNVQDIAGAAFDTVPVDTSASQTPPDYLSTQIGSEFGSAGDAGRLREVFRRDLEDFAQLGLEYSKLLGSLTDSVRIEVRDPNTTGLAVRLHRSHSAGLWALDQASQTHSFSATGHVTNQGTMADLIEAVSYNYLHPENGQRYQNVYAEGGVTMTIDEFESRFGYLTQPNSHMMQLMFEAIRPGQGELVVSFMRNGQVVADRAIHLDVRYVDELYEHHTIAYTPAVGPDGDWSSSNDTIDPKATPVAVVPNFASGAQARTFSATDDYFLFVHGWNMNTFGRKAFAATAFKRLYWQGYRGTFGLFSWPTQYGSDLSNFNRSEEVAWSSGQGLNNLLTSLQPVRAAGGKLTILAHSMGAIVASEALAIAGGVSLLDSSIFTQAAVTTEFFQSVATPTDYYPAFGGEVGGAAPRFGQINQAGGRMVNFYNTGDYALALWFGNHELRPGGPHYSSGAMRGFLGAEYEAIAGPPPVITRELPGGAPAILRMGFDTYEMFAHGLYTESVALGASPAGPFGPLAAGFNLRSIGVGSSRPDHSAQFNHSNVEMNSYWSQVMIEAGL